MRTDFETTEFDVVIIGGGPAGQAAAAETAKAGLSTCIVDEQQQPGGQILRQPPPDFRVKEWLPSPLYAALKRQLREAEGNDAIIWTGGTSVVGIWPEEHGFRLTLSGGRTGEIVARRLLVASGCYDMPVPLPGWTLPGVMSAGGVQAFVKSQLFAPGDRFILFGTHPLQLVVAEQLVAAGARVEAVLFPQPLASVALILAAGWPAILTNWRPMLQAALSYWSLVRAGTAIHFGAGVTRIAGETAVEGVEAMIGGKPRQLACDAAAMCFGFLPQADLVRSAGAAVRWSEPAGGWETLHDPWMRSSLAGLYVAGETTGVAGADAALLEGRLAGIAIALDAGGLGAAQAHRLARPIRKGRARLGRFINLLRALAAPGRWLPAVDADTILCRCEDVSAAMIDEAIANAAIAGPDASAVKLRCRAGMGQCQGRSCEHVVMRRIGARHGCPSASVEGFKARFPSRPTPIADLIS